MRGTADMQVALGRIAWQCGDAADSARHLDRAAELGEGAGLPQQPYRWRVAMADLRASVGDWPGADALLEEAERLYVGDFSPDVRPVGAIRARLWVRAGDLAAARRWARRTGAVAARRRQLRSASTSRSRWRGSCSPSTPSPAARRSSPTPSTSSNDCRMPPTPVGGREPPSRWRCSWPGPTTPRATGDQALEALRRALHLAQPEGWVRVLADEGVALRGLLDAVGDLGGDPRFLADVGAAAQASAQPPGGPPPGGRTVSTAAGRPRAGGQAGATALLHRAAQRA